MDLLCPKCSEPWDNDTLHEMVEEGAFPNYDAAAKDFRKNGCETFGSSHNAALAKGRPFAAQAASALYDILGDDMDGAAAMLEDMGL